MKNFNTLTFVLISFFNFTNGYGQDGAVNDTVCIMEGEAINYNVLDNDNIPPMVHASLMTPSPCFILLDDGELMWKQGAENCCGDHVLKYRLTGYTGNNFMAFIHITVKCPKPNCTNIDLSDVDPGGPIGGVQKPIFYACEDSKVTYYVDYVAGYTYTWTVNGGTYVFPTPSNQSIIDVIWNTVGPTTIQLMTNNGITTTTEIFCIEVLPAPVAGFTTTMNCVCLNSPISFTNTSSGASSYYWDFGDGNNTTMPNPTHNYSLPGTYTVTLYAYSSNYDPLGNPLCCCVDSVQMQILVEDLPGPNIYWVSTVCEGDSSKYWTDAVGCTYTWMVTDANNNPVLFTGNGNDTICVV
ncbi:MAG: PKD domain-containing protein, partial [Saprospiraceae bacterium]|nr:PKD domain-containing protein [Saprospiraceae bacterium]